MKAQRDGIQGVVIDCMEDPGMMAAWEVVSIPVIGPGEAAMHMAAMMGNQFSCVTITESVRPIFHSHARVYGVYDKMASVRVIDMPLQDLEKYLKKLWKRSISNHLKRLKKTMLILLSWVAQDLLVLLRIFRVC